jgi:membrane-bound lytic murein transglycosylase D
MIISRLSYRTLIILFSVILTYGCAHHPAPNQDGAAKTAVATAVATAVVDEGPPLSHVVRDPADLSAPDQQPEKSASSAKKEAVDDDEALLDTALELTETAQEYWEDNDMDNAIESLDQAYALILTVPGNNPKLTQQKDDLRFMISKRIMELYASRQVAVKGNHNEIPRVVNAHVQKEIQSFQTVERDFFLESYKRSGRYRAGWLRH